MAQFFEQIYFFITIDFLSVAFYVVETIGIISFALSGVILAKRKDFDFVGVYIIAWVTAFGGGIFRDLILDIQPVYWIAHAEYPLMILILTLIISLIKRIKIQEHWLTIPDTLGLATFAITASQTAYSLNLPMIIVGILATVVATFGGVLRDVFCQEIPIIFKKGTTMYASIAFMGACLFVSLCDYALIDQFYSMIISIAFIFVFRLIAIRFNLILKF